MSRTYNVLFLCIELFLALLLENLDEVALRNRLREFGEEESPGG